MKWGMLVMQSRTSSINKKLLVYIFRSSGWISLLYLIGLLFSLPLEVVMSVLEKRAQYNETEINLLFMYGTLQNALILVIPVLLAVFLFRFLQVKQTSDFIHSLPLSRKQIYVHQLMSGVGFLLLPILLTAMILLIFLWTMDVSSLYTLKDIGLWIGITFIIELLIFSATVLMGMITGLSALQAVLSYVLLLLPVGLILLFVSNIKFLLFGFSASYYLNSNIYKLSPVTATMAIRDVKLFTIEIFVYLLLAVCLLFVSYLLYKKRKHEFVSHAFVFPVFKPVFKYGLITGLMLLSGLYFSDTTGHVGWLLFGYVTGAIFGYLLAEMVLQKTWRIKVQLKGFGYYVVVILACVVLIKLDFIGFQSKVPETSSIKKVFISKDVSNHYDDSNPDTNPILKEDSNIRTLRKLHEQIIEHGKDERFALNGEYPSVFLMYELENGQKEAREYHLRNYDAFTPYFKKIYESQEYKKKAYPLIQMSPKDVYRIQVSSNGSLDKSIQLSDSEEIAKATEALQADLAKITYEQMTNPVGDFGQVVFTLEKNRSIQFPWLASFQHFNEWMEQTGKAEKARVQAKDLQYMMVQEYESGIDYYSPDFVPQKNAFRIEKTEQMDSLLRTISSNIEGKYVVVLYYKGGRSVEVRGLPAEYAPDYVSNHFKK